MSLRLLLRVLMNTSLHLLLRVSMSLHLLLRVLMNTSLHLSFVVSANPRHRGKYHLFVYES
jgi:hypothetical protein